MNAALISRYRLESCDKECLGILHYEKLTGLAAAAAAAAASPHTAPFKHTSTLQ